MLTGYLNNKWMAEWGWGGWGGNTSSQWGPNLLVKWGQGAPIAWGCPNFMTLECRSIV